MQYEAKVMHGRAVAFHSVSTSRELPIRKVVPFATGAIMQYRMAHNSGGQSRFVAWTLFSPDFGTGKFKRLVHTVIGCCISVFTAYVI